MDKAKLESVAKALCQPGKGILAADESTGTIEKRFKTINLESTPETRRAWRELLFTTKGINKFLSGVILFDETIRQGLVSGLQKEGIIPGIKVDTGTKPLDGFPGELITLGLDGLDERLAQYAKLGAQFTKWRAVINLGEGLPTDQAITGNAQALAQFAVKSQSAGLVPIVEPETLMEGEHAIQVHAEATKRVLTIVFSELNQAQVYLPGMLLKTNMVASGLAAKTQVSAGQVAEATLAVFKAAVPETVPGIVFLSGGLSPEASTVNLDAINKLLKSDPVTWQLSFSYGRALQGEALEIWRGKDENLIPAQKAFFDRAQAVARAREGKL